MKAYFLRFFTFNNWANALIANFLIENHIQDEEVCRIMSHIVHAQSNWYYRVAKRQQDVPVWNTISPESIFTGLDENGKRWLALIETMSEENLHDILPYHNMAGEPHLNTVADVLTHLVNHSTYHRGK